MAQILLVDDNVELLEVQAEFLSAHDQQVHTATNGRQALRILEDAAVDVLVTDIIMPEMEGFETMMEVRKRYPNLPIIVVSGGGRVGATDYLSMAKSMGADATLSKPVQPSALLAEAQWLIEHAKTTAE